MIDDRMTEEKLSDSDVLERLIYKAFVSPDKFLPHDTGDALLTFAMAMRLYHRICAQENLRAQTLESDLDRNWKTRFTIKGGCQDAP